MSPRTRRLSELHAMMGHTLQLMDAWMCEIPFSDIVTRKSHHLYNLPND